MSQVKQYISPAYTVYTNIIQNKKKHRLQSDKTSKILWSVIYLVDKTNWKVEHKSLDLLTVESINLESVFPHVYSEWKFEIA